MQWLDRSNIPYQLLRLKTKRRSDLYIISNRIISGESITENGTHYGVEIFGQVFDNLSRTGLSRDAWLCDFSCRSGAFIIEPFFLSREIYIGLRSRKFITIQKNE